MNKNILIIIAILVLAAAGFAIYKSNQTVEPVNNRISNMAPNNSQPGTYQDYSAETVKSEQEAGNRVVLFFYAPWCPFCRAADSAFLSKLNEIPSGVVVLKTDYDSNTELKQKYGVTYQHTFVQIDAAGNQVSKWNGGDIDNLIKYLK